MKVNTACGFSNTQNYTNKIVACENQNTTFAYDCNLNSNPIAMANKYSLSFRSKKSEIREKIKQSVAEGAVENKEYDKIFTAMGIEVKKDSEDGMLILSHFAIPDGIFLSRFGIDENEMFKSVKKINGDADFYGTSATDLGNIRIIKGNIDLFKTGIKTLGELCKIEGDADFTYCSLEDLGKLKSVEGNLSMNKSKITSLANLERIGGDVSFTNSEVTDLGKLKSVEGEISLYKSKLTQDDFKNVKIRPDAFSNQKQSENIVPYPVIYGF